jgi:hypothetical protein
MPDELVLREKAREAIRSGKLPSRKPGRKYGGPGSGKLCSLCGERVTLEQIEMGIEFNRHGVQPGLDRYYLHVGCLAAWEFQRTQLSV